MRVEHHGGGEAAQRRPRRRSGPDRDHAAVRRGRPPVGQQRDRLAGPADARRDLLGPPTRRREYEDVLGPDPMQHLEHDQVASSAGANRSTAGPGAARAASTSATAPPPGESGRSRETPLAGGSCRTTRGGDALPRNAESGPAHRHDAHSASSTTGAGGPMPLERAIGFGSTPSVGATSTSTTQAPTRRPCRSIRTRLPTPTASESEGGTR